MCVVTKSPFCMRMGEDKRKGRGKREGRERREKRGGRERRNRRENEKDEEEGCNYGLAHNLGVLKKLRNCSCPVQSQSWAWKLMA